MHSYADTFEQPIVETIDGKEVTIPLLTQRDFLGWIEELTKERKDKAMKVAPPAGKTQTLERSQWMDYVENLEVTPHEIRVFVFRVKGMTRVIELALRKAGVEDKNAIDNFIDSRGAKDNEMLAVRVSGLFRREELEQMYPKISKPREEKSGDDPNDGAADNQSAAASTGRSSVSSSKVAAA